MIKHLALACLCSTIVISAIACSPSTFSKEQELYDDVARYACYAAAGQRATEALHGGCPDLLRDAKAAVSCPIIDQVITVLQSDLEKCDEQPEEPKVLAPPPSYGNKVAAR